MPLLKLCGFINLLFAGILAGEEFVICYGVRTPVASLDEPSHIRLRQALIRTLRVLVPTVFGLAILAGVGVTILGGPGIAKELRYAGLVALLFFISVTLGGTVPINEAVLTWDAAAPPKEWRALVNKWERLDTVRTWAAISAFCLFLAAMNTVS